MNKLELTPTIKAILKNDANNLTTQKIIKYLHLFNYAIPVFNPVNPDLIYSWKECRYPNSKGEDSFVLSKSGNDKITGGTFYNINIYELSRYEAELVVKDQIRILLEK